MCGRSLALENLKSSKSFSDARFAVAITDDGDRKAFERYRRLTGAHWLDVRPFVADVAARHPLATTLICSLTTPPDARVVLAGRIMKRSQKRCY